MISKKILLATVCLAVLIIAVGAYGYALYSEVSSLGSRLEDLQREINLLKYRVGFSNSSKAFNFFWGGPIAEKFNVTTFWMNITFQRTNETHLLIKVKVNDLGHSTAMGIAFDVNHNGEIDRGDQGYMYQAVPFYTEGTKHYGAIPHFLGPYREDGQRFFETFAAVTISGLHTCDFDPGLGYTYIVSVNLQDVFWAQYPHKVVELINDLIHVEYWGNVQDGKANVVSVEFCFGMELIA